METDWIFFDCMETLVDINPVPKTNDYASWAFYGSGVEEFWKDFDHFLKAYVEAMALLNAEKTGYEEWSTIDRFRKMCSLTPGLPEDQVELIIERLQNNFFSTYCSKSHIHPDVKEILPLLSSRYNLGVVSNFKIENGITTILSQHDLLKYFKWVLTSAEIGWRKPHPSIYQAALKQSDTTADHILFVGDDPENDISTPLTFGMSAVLLDRDSNQRDINFCRTVKNFYQLGDLIL